MEGKILLVNDIVKYETEECYDRVLWVDEKYEYCYTIKLFTSKIYIQKKYIDDIEREIANGFISILEQDPFFRVVDPKELSEKNKELIDMAYEIVNYVASSKNEPECFFGKNRGRIVQQAVEKYSISKKTIYKYLRRYWQRGKIKNALLSDFYKCGTMERKCINKKLGRPSYLSILEGKPHGINVDEETKSIFRVAMNRFFLNKKGISLANTYRLMLADNGEMVGPIAEKIISNLEISLENAPSYRGDAKGIVEQYFHVINTSIKHWLPGEVKKEYRERGERDYRLDARLDIYEFTQIIIHAVLQRNKRLMKKYPLSQEMINDGVNPIPIEIWNWGLKNKSGNLRRLSDEFVRLNLMRHDKATVTEKGVLFNGMTYSCELTEVEKWFSKSRVTGRWYIDIAYDNRDVTTINIIDKEANRFIPCSLSERISSSNLFKGKTFEEVLDYNFISIIRNTELHDKLNQNQFILDSKVQSIINQAEVLSGHEKRDINDIKENRKIENIELKKNQSLSFDNMDSYDSISESKLDNKIETFDDTPRSNTLKKFQQFRKEEKGNYEK